MNIPSKTTYYNSIYKAIVVNTEYNQDPENNYRVQIYIPSMQKSNADIYTDYINDKNKSDNDKRVKFPWAVSLVKDLKEGNIVYGSFINNDMSEHIILGLQANNPANENNSSSSSSVNVGGILDLAMPIIIHNEVGIPTNAWPNNISDDKYTRINPYDNGGWSIGLIQWHHCRAYDCCLEIVKNDSSWRDKFLDKTCDLYTDLNSCSTSARDKYQSDFHPTPGSAMYKGIQNILGSDKGKEIQRNFAQENTRSALSKLQGEPYNIQNPAVLIFMADLMNQYGEYMPETMAKASELCKRQTDNVIIPLDMLIDHCKANIATYNTYRTRRETTYAYIKDLNNQGKLNMDNPVDIAGEGNAIAGNGQYCIPFKGTFSITSGWGAHGYASSKRPHAGLDFGCPTGTPIIACTSGQAEYKTSAGGFGNHVMLHADDGNLIVFGHMSRFQGGTRHVNKGDVIGYAGNTGNSFGSHLHLGITKSGESGLWNANWSRSLDPGPFLGISSAVGTRVQGA